MLILQKCLLPFRAKMRGGNSFYPTKHFGEVVRVTESGAGSNILERGLRSDHLAFGPLQTKAVNFIPDGAVERLPKSFLERSSVGIYGAHNIGDSDSVVSVIRDET